MADHGVLDLLPEVIRTTARPGTPLAALGAVADDLHAPVIDVLDRLDAAVDPFRASPAFVRYLAGWVDLGWLAAADAEAGARSSGGVTVSRLRDVIAASAELSARRGTPGGLERLLHLATGIDGYAVEDVAGEFHVRVVVPAAAAGQVELVRTLVRAMRPAHVTSEVLVAAAPAGSALPAPAGPPPTLPPSAPPTPPPPTPPPPPPPAPPPRAGRRGDRSAGGPG